ncbi:hypothetical protein VCSRO33_0967 [Vibrio cholerae]|nr:hypothetical protein VCSRO33_0967 [Vibrio cholerae]
MQNRHIAMGILLLSLLLSSWLIGGVISNLSKC